ncbi:hypothetical protein ACU4GD_36295 [Cupriavidus basilensis]
MAAAIRVFNPAFAPDPDLARPMILVGPGTGDRAVPVVSWKSARGGQNGRWPGAVAASRLFITAAAIRSIDWLYRDDGWRAGRPGAWCRRHAARFHRAGGAGPALCAVICRWRSHRETVRAMLQDGATIYARRRRPADGAGGAPHTDRNRSAAGRA